MATVGLCSLFEQGCYPWLYGGEWIESLVQSMSYPGTIGGAVPISTIANRSAAGWRLYHHQQQTQVFEKDGERPRPRWSYVLLHFICDEHGYGTNAMHNGVVCFFTTAAIKTVKSSPSTSGSWSREKILSMCRTLDPIYHVLPHLHSHFVWLSALKSSLWFTINLSTFQLDFPHLATHPLRTKPW